MFLFVTEVESEVIDKLKYIEETKETMDKNTKKLSEIVESMSDIFTGKATQILFVNLCHCVLVSF